MPVIVLIAAAMTAATDCTDLCEPGVIRLYAMLSARSALDRHASEWAAFIIRREKGGYRAILWPRGEESTASYRGSPPPSTIAIAHTHPPVAPDPSRHDILEARRVRLPIVVITQDRVTVVEPTGETVVLFGAGWTRRID